MDFGILGPLEVRYRGQPVAIPGRHAPRLLAVLLLEAGRLVTVDRLIDVLWPHDPPATARRQVQNVLAGLRRALPESGVITADGNGYRIELDGNTFDHREFRRLRTMAREAGPAESLRLLNQALDRWRGEALAELPGNAFEAAAVKFAEERLGAVEERISLELDSNAPPNVVEELRRLARDNPYRQRVVALLMRALWQRGGASEALAVYGELRERLAEQLGLDPDLEVVDLYERICRGETEITAPRTSHGPTPGQLPAPPSTFTGRREHLAELDDLLEQGQKAAVVTAIAGMGGAGKTALALHWGHRVRERFPDGQLYINLRGYDDAEPVPPIEALGRFLVALGQSSTSLPSGVDEASRLFRSLLTKRRMLVVLDNARAEEQVRPLLPGGTENLAVVTSRDRLAGLTTLNDAVPIRLDTLSPEESLELLENIVGIERLRAEAASARRITELCGYLPLALRIAGANLAAQPEVKLDDFAAELAGPKRLERLNVDGDAKASVARVIELSLAGLDTSTLGLFHALGTIPGADFGRGLAAHLFEGGKDRAAAAISTLESANLLDQFREGRFRFHDLIREVAAAGRPPRAEPSWREKARERVIGWFYDNRDSLSAEEGPSMIAALRAWRHDPQAWKLGASIHPFADTADNVREMLSLTVGIAQQAERHADAVGLAQNYHSLAHLTDAVGLTDEAIAWQRKAVTVINREPGGDQNGTYSHYLSSLLRNIGNLAEAKKHGDAALATAVRSGDQMNIARFASSAASTARQEGRFAEAEKYLRFGLENTSEQPLTFARVVLLGESAGVYRDMAKYESALEAVTEALEWTIANGNSRLEILARTLRSDIFLLQQRPEAARADIVAALTRVEETRRDDSRYDAQIQLAEVELAGGRYAEAEELLRELDQYELLHNNVSARAEIARIWCLLYNALDRPDDAIQTGKAAAQLYEGIPWPLKQARCLVAVAVALSRNGENTAAAEHRAQAHAILTRLNHPEAVPLRALLTPPQS